MTREFVAWPKIPRFNRGMTVSEKIDGTNACVVVTADDIYAQSRSRIITPDQDNYGFARWVWVNQSALREDLGEGRHFGEWWGQGIQRGYGLDHRRFSLFNTRKWEPAVQHFVTPNLDVVPVLAEGVFSQDVIDECCLRLRAHGSFAADFARPEGVVVFHHASNSMFKILLEGDDRSKGETA